MRQSDLPKNVYEYWDKILKTIPLPPTSFGDIARSSLEDLGPEHWADIVSADPVLCGRIMVVANSAAVGLIKPVSDVKQAIVHLGGNTTRVIVLGYYIEGLLGRNNVMKKSYFKHIRKWSACAAVLAYNLMKAAHLPEPGTVSTAALLSRIGSLILALEWPGPNEGYLAFTDEVERLAYEEETWKVNSAILSRMVLAFWELPDPLPSYVENHLEALHTRLTPTMDTAVQTVLATSVTIGAQYVRDQGMGIDDVVYQECHRTLVDNLAAHNLLDGLSQVWSRDVVQEEMQIMMKQWG